MQKTLESVFLPRYESLKLNHDIWRHGWRSVDECSIFYKEQDSFFITCYSPSTVFIFIAKKLKSVFLPRYESLKLNHDTDFLMTSEDTVEDPLMSVRFDIKSQSFFFSC